MLPRDVADHARSVAYTLPELAGVEFRAVNAPPPTSGVLTFATTLAPRMPRADRRRSPACQIRPRSRGAGRPRARRTARSSSSAASGDPDEDGPAGRGQARRQLTERRAAA